MYKIEVELMIPYKCKITFESSEHSLYKDLFDEVKNLEAVADQIEKIDRMAKNSDEHARNSLMELRDRIIQTKQTVRLPKAY
jgi:hypothetical protein